MNALLFLLICLGFYEADLLNYSQAGKNAAHALFPFMTVWAWSRLKTPVNHRATVKWYTLIAGIILLFMSIQAFLRQYFGVEHDDTMVIEAIFNTNPGETSEFFSHNALFMLKYAAIFATSLLLFWFLSSRYATYLDRRQAAHPVQHPPRLQKTMAVLAPLLLIALHFNPTARKSNPLLYLPIYYAEWQASVAQASELQKTLEDTKNDPQLAAMHYAGAGPRTVVFVLGESQPKHNWSLYGYPRKTSPRLDAMRDELAVYSDILSAGDATVRSLKLMLTPADHDAPELWNRTPSLLTQAKQAGYKVFWLSNQSTSARANGVVGALAGNADVLQYTNKGEARSEGSVDEVLLPALDAALKDPAPLKFIVLHTLGAHPAYHFRYPEAFAKFNDVKDEVSEGLRKKGRNAWAIIQRNEFDNAMLYADHVLAETLERLKQEGDSPIAWLFTPDHGEDVAHYSNYAGHNGRVNTMWELPLLLWTSNSFPREELTVETDRPYQNDGIQHSLLGLMGIKGPYYRAEDDLFSSRFTPRPRYTQAGPYQPDPVDTGQAEP